MILLKSAFCPVLASLELKPSLTLLLASSYSKIFGVYPLALELFIFPKQTVEKLVLMYHGYPVSPLHGRKQHSPQQVQKVLCLGYRKAGESVSV
jgi:hypothetical protein